MFNPSDDAILVGKIVVGVLLVVDAVIGKLILYLAKQRLSFWISALKDRQLDLSSISLYYKTGEIRSTIDERIQKYLNARDLSEVRRCNKEAETYVLELLYQISNYKTNFQEKFIGVPHDELDNFLKRGLIRK